MPVDIEDKGKVGEVGAGALGVSGVVAHLQDTFGLGWRRKRLTMMMMTVLQPSLDHSSWLRSKKAQARLLVPLLGMIKT